MGPGEAARPAPRPGHQAPATVFRQDVTKGLAKIRGLWGGRPRGHSEGQEWLCVCASMPVCLCVCVHVCAWLALRSRHQEQEGSCEACLGSRPQAPEAPVGQPGGQVSTLFAARPSPHLRGQETRSEAGMRRRGITLSTVQNLPRLSRGHLRDLP